MYSSRQPGQRREAAPREASGRCSWRHRELHDLASDAVTRLIKRIGARAGLAFPVHAHMLRHACGYALANAGHDTRRIQDWLGHRSIQHTARYTQLSAAPFKDFWR
jgi:site-specific recombinase XerD